MRHIALLIPGLDRLGGAERQVILLAKGLRQRGWRVTVVALSGSGAGVAAELAQASVAFTSLGMRKGLADPRGWLRFHRWLRRERPDVVHTHLPHATWLARWSRLAAPIPVLVDTLHSSATGGLARRLGYRCSGWLGDCVTAVSHSAADAHARARMIDRGKLVVLPNGVDVETWRPDASARAGARRELGLANEFLWLAAGRLEPVKDCPTLLQAMTGIPEPARLVIAGSGPHLDALLKLSARLGLDQRVRFLGFQPDVRRWMQAADGFVLCSLWEGLPTVTLEAAACALPVVATDVPGTSEAVADGTSGILVPPADPASLAAAMTALMQSSPQERAALGARARQHAAQHFSLHAVLDRWEELYEALDASHETAPSAKTASSSEPESATAQISHTLSRQGRPGQAQPPPEFDPQK